LYEKLFDVHKIVLASDSSIDDKVKSLNWGLQPAGRSRIQRATKRYSVIEGDHAAVRSQTTLVTWRDYYNETGVVGVYYTKDRGAFITYGAIRQKFLEFGGVASYLGFPTSDEAGNAKYGNENVRWSHFNGGTVWWNPMKGAYVDVSLSTVKRQYSTWRLTAIDVTGLTPGGHFNVYGTGMSGLPDTRHQGFGFGIASADGTAYGFNAAETWISPDQQSEYVKKWWVEDALTGRKANDI
jgi:hypothetical protein